MAHRAKDLALSLLWPGSLLWCGFDPWARNFRMPWGQPKIKKHKTKRGRKLSLLVDEAPCMPVSGVDSPEEENEYRELKSVDI